MEGKMKRFAYSLFSVALVSSSVLGADRPNYDCRVSNFAQKMTQTFQYSSKERVDIGLGKISGSIYAYENGSVVLRLGVQGESTKAISVGKDFPGYVEVLLSVASEKVSARMFCNAVPAQTAASASVVRDSACPNGEYYCKKFRSCVSGPDDCSW